MEKGRHYCVVSDYNRSLTAKEITTLYGLENGVHTILKE